MFVPNRELGDFLIDTRLMPRDEVARILDSGENLFEIARMQSLVPHDELLRAAAHALGVPFIELSHDNIDEEALLLIPEPLSRVHSMALYKIEGHNAHVALADLDALSRLSYLEDERHLRPVPHFTDRASLKRALLIQQKRLKEKFGEKLARSSAEGAIDALFSHALLSRAREIHLDPTSNGGLRVRYRIGSGIHEAMVLSQKVRGIIEILKQSAGLSLTLLAPQEGRFKLALQSGEQVRVGVFTLPSHAGERVLLHLTPEHAGKNGFTLESLGLHGEALSLMHEALGGSEGLILVSSPAGHGKTTSLYTLLDIATPTHALAMSVEEKISLPLSSVTQTEVKKDLGATLASTLKAALKHNPDILMVDSLEEENDAQIAAAAASRGVFVIAGIKSASASKAIQKMLSLDVDPLLLSAALRASVGQRVVRKLCPACREAYTPSRADIAALEAHANFGRVLAALKAEGVVEQNAQWKDIKFYNAKGCSECENGYAGQTALFEVLPVSRIAKELIQDTKSLREEQEKGLSDNLPLTLIEDGLFKAASGLTTLEEVVEAVAG